MAHANGQSAAKTFNDLPLEINKLIALHLDDRTLAAFRLICCATNAAVDRDNLSFWRTKFRETYDLPKGRTNADLMQIYKVRAVFLRRGIPHNYFRGYSNFQMRVVRVLRGLIVESYYGAKPDENGRLVSKNHDHLIKFIKESGLFNHDRRAPPPSEDEPAHVREHLAAVKLVCFHFVLDFPPLTFNFLAFDESQFAVYQPSFDAPLFNDGYTHMNTEYLLHNMNFWRHHMMNEEFQSLYDNFGALPLDQKPSVWREPLRNGVQPLSRYWRGSYAFLRDNDLQRLRRQGPGDRYYEDQNIDEGKLQFLEIDFATDGRFPSGQELRWPCYYERILNSLLPFATTVPSTVKTQGSSSTGSDDGRAYDIDVFRTKSLFFEGKGQDIGNKFQSLGWLNPLPPQGDIPGWQRFTMMKAFGEDSMNHQADRFWAYEGVVIPGNRIILGRWTYASEAQVDRGAVGPFILWAVEEPKPEPVSDDEDGSDAEAEPETNAETETNAEPNTNAESETNAEPETNVENNMDAEPEVPN